jgi:aspartate kinase
METGTKLVGGGQNHLSQCIVMKFGGTSVEDAASIRRVGALVKSRVREHPVVVVSAMARVTDQLLAGARVAAEDPIQTTEILDRLSDRHLQVAHELLHGENWNQLRRELQCELDLIRELATKVQADRALSSQVQDHWLGIGESLSSKIMRAWLRQIGVDAVWVDAKDCVVTDAAYGRATPIWDETNKQTKVSIMPLLENRRVPVLGGFVGATRDRVPTTLGRGGSDFSAAIIGAALYARRIEIWTDVDGVMTTDPNLCPEARCLRRMSFDEAADLAYFGAKVLHPSTLVPAMASGIPVHVLNSRNPECDGTEILPQIAGRNEVKAVAMKNVAIVNIDSMHGLPPAPPTEVFDAFHRHRQEIDLVSASPGRLLLIVNEAVALPEIAEELKSLASVRWQNHKALVSLVGEQIRSRPEIVSRALHAVAGLDARLTWLGVSERSISFLIEEPQAEEAVQRLHACFFSRQEVVDARRADGVPFHALCQAGAWH